MGAKSSSWKVLDTILSRSNESSSEIVMQSLVFVAVVEFDSDEIKEGVPDPPELEELTDSHEESTQVDEEQVNKNLPSDEADSDMEANILDTSEEQRSTKACGECTI